MLPALATVGAAALAASTILVPVTAVGDAGWTKAGSGDYTITFTEDSVDFYTESPSPDMKLAKLGAADLQGLLGDGLDWEGENAHLAFYSYVDVEGSFMPRYTAIVFESDDPSHVMLTWGSSPNEYIPTADFFKMIEEGELTGFAYQVEVGHTDSSAQKESTSASVDYISFGDYTFDFGTGADEAPGLPGKGNENGLGNGNGNGNPPANGHDKDKNKA